MKLTARSEYALLALVYLARHREDGLVPAQRIAAAQAIPERFLEQILMILKRARCLHSSKGKGGGFQLAREPSDVTLAEVIRLFDGALAPIESVSKYFHKSTPIEKEDKLLTVFRDVRDYVAAKMENTTLADVV